MNISDLPLCPNCGDRNLSEVADYVSPDEPDRTRKSRLMSLSPEIIGQSFGSTG